MPLSKDTHYTVSHSEIVISSGRGRDAITGGIRRFYADLKSPHAALLYKNWEHGIPHALDIASASGRYGPQIYSLEEAYGLGAKNCA